MAISQITKAWKSEALKEPRMVLIALALADWANEEGWCWPSMESLGEKARCSDRTARRIIRKMQKIGVIEVEEHRGRNNTNRYRLVFEIEPAAFQLKPVTVSDLPEIKPDKSCRKPDISTQNRTNRALKPDKAVSGEPSKNRHLEPKEPSGAFALPDWIPSEPWQEWINFRKKNRWPITPYVLNKAVADLDRFRKRGYQPKQVLDLAIFRGWRGLFEPKDPPEGATNKRKFVDAAEEMQRQLRD